MKTIIFTIIVGMAFLSSQSWADTSKLNIITEQYQPYNFIDPNDGSHKMQGIAVDLLVEMLKKTGSSQSRKDIQMQPWARGYEAVKNEKTLCSFLPPAQKKEKIALNGPAPLTKLKQK